MMQMDAVVQAVEPRKVTAQGVERTVYDIVDGSGTKWTAWERPLAEEAFALRGVPAVWEVEQKPNTRRPEFPYRNIKGIVAKSSSSMDQALSSGFPEIVKSEPGGFDQPGGTLTPKDEQIHRQTAVKAVAVLAGAGGMTPDEFWSNVRTIAHYFDTGEAPGSFTESVAKEQGTATFTGPQPDDDIPF